MAVGGPGRGRGQQVRRTFLRAVKQLGEVRRAMRHPALVRFAKRSLDNKLRIWPWLGLVAAVWRYHHKRGQSLDVRRSHRHRRT